MRKLLAVALAVLAPAAAHAQQTQSWVSGVGDDANPCIRVAPCLTWAGALAKTAAGGEIDALDPGDFGPVAITQAVTLEGHVGDQTGGTPSTGIIVAAGAADAVVLRNLALTGQGDWAGISFVSGGSLVVQNVTIASFANGIDIEAAASAQVLIDNVRATNNLGAGLQIGSSGGTVTATVLHSRFERNFYGVRAIGGARVNLYDVSAEQNLIAGVAGDLDAAGGNADMNLEHVILGGNGAGVRAIGASGSSVVRLSNVVALDDTDAVEQVGVGRLFTFANNRVAITPSLSIVPETKSQTVSAGNDATFTADVLYLGLHAAPIDFACSGLPAGVGCTVAPGSMANGVNSMNLLVTVTTTAPQAGAIFGIPDALPPLVLFALIGLLAFAARRRAPLRAAFGLALLVAACTSTHTQPITPGTPAGTYAFTVTATSGTVTASANLSLTVE